MTTPPTPDAVSSYEELAEQFYDATGVMAPGKDVAAAMGPYDADLLRHKLWRVWLEKRALTAQLAAAKADGERRDEAIVEYGVSVILSRYANHVREYRLTRPEYAREVMREVLCETDKMLQRAARTGAR